MHLQRELSVEEGRAGKINKGRDGTQCRGDREERKQREGERNSCIRSASLLPAPFRAFGITDYVIIYSRSSTLKFEE